MLYALDAESSVKISPVPGARARCPDCGEEVLAKCGTINIWHWAHLAGQDCEVWSEPETEWHLDWKMRWPKEYVEVSIAADGRKHRADVVTPKGDIIEFQHTSLSLPQVAEREAFYGKRLIWVFDVIEPYESERLYFRFKGDYFTFRWLHPRKYVIGAKGFSIWDIGDALYSVGKVYGPERCAGWCRPVDLSHFLRHHGALYVTPAVESPHRQV